MPHTLGNLTLVTGSKNAAMSNQAWTAKLGYLATSSLLMLGQQKDEFFLGLREPDPTLAIGLRGAAIARWALQIWPRPGHAGQLIRAAALVATGLCRRSRGRQDF